MLRVDKAQVKILDARQSNDTDQRVVSPGGPPPPHTHTHMHMHMHAETHMHMHTGRDTHKE